MTFNTALDRRGLMLGGVTLAASSAITGGTTPAAHAQASSLSPQLLPPSPEWARALPPGPDTSVKTTEAYAAMIARDAYFWAWPLVNIYNKRLNFKDTPEPMMVGPGPAAPLNRLAMLTDYIDPEERLVACPNQDVVYGAGSLALDLSPVVIQVPDFGDRFWVYQMVDLRTDGFVQLGKNIRHDARLLSAGRAELARRHSQGHFQGLPLLDQHRLRRAALFQDDTPGDKKAIQSVLQWITMYPLAEYDGRMKSIDWTKIRKVPAAATGKRSGCSLTSFSTSFPISLRTRLPCLARKRDTRRCAPCLKRSRTTRR